MGDGDADPARRWRVVVEHTMVHRTVIVALEPDLWAAFEASNADGTLPVAEALKLMARAVARGGGLETAARPEPGSRIVESAILLDA